MNTSAFAPTRHRVADMAPARFAALCALWDRVWPPAPEVGARAGRAEEVRRSMAAEGREVFVIWEDENPAAVSAIFPREIRTTAGPLRVMALASVCSSPERRGAGLGRRVVQAAFAEVDRGAGTVSLFQTGVPDFYRKLGARSVENPFVNSRFRPGDRGSAAQPWWEPHIMIYPAAFPWPAGPVDLLGPGF